MATTPDVLTVGEVAAFMRVSRETVYRLATRGELPGRKIGRIWRFPKGAIQEYVEGKSVVGHAGREAQGRDPTAADSDDDEQRLPVSTGALEP
ncbi:MAG: helix-turn-helix domain-containing protein [Planctomycetes bacterium]|nr:helix-turn-helix domain-containing protein [Planctomycetota bacterium]